MMGPRREMPRWVNDLVRQAEILGQRQVTPGWANDLAW